MTRILLLLMIISLCSCEKDEKDENAEKPDLYEEPIREWGISVENLKSKVLFPVFKEEGCEKTTALVLNGVKLIGNKPAYVEYRDINQRLESITYWFYNDNTTLNATSCLFKNDSDFYNKVLGFLRTKYGIEKSNTDKFINWIVDDTYIVLTKRDSDSNYFSVSYFDIRLITDPPAKVRDVIIKPSNLFINVEESAFVEWQVYPSNAKYKIKLYSEDSGVVLFTNETIGALKGISKGKTRIIVNIEGTSISDTCNVEVAANYTAFNFDHVKSVESDALKYKYDVFYEVNSAGAEIMDWASGNSGFALTGAGEEDPSSFPTFSVADGYKGKGVKMVTRATGSFGVAVKMYIAAGNLFMGTFDVSKALDNALKATQFGMPFEHVPTYLKGYYKYKSGDVYQENGEPVDGKKDTWDAYAIFYETDANTKILDATNQFTHSNLISVARISEKDRLETDEWTQFYLPFVMKPGKSIDREKLKAGKYNLAIVFSSSIEGDRFKGAVGSTLYIDEVELITE